MSHAQPPHDDDAERAVLSACMLSAEAFDSVAGLLEPESFWKAAHRDIWTTIVEVYGANQKVDLVTIAQRMRQADTLDRIGGTPYLAEISDATPAVAHAEEHAKIVSDKARLRGIIDLCRKTASEASGDVRDVDAFTGDLEAALGDVARSGKSSDTQRTAKELSVGASQEYYQRKRDGSQFRGIPTGFRDLDKLLNGMKAGKYLVAGRPGSGKTGFLVSVARNVAHTGFGVAFISIEQDKEEQIQRVIAQEGLLDTALIDSGRLHPQDEARFQSAVRTAASLPIVFDDAPAQTVASIRSAVRRAMRRLRKEFPTIKLGLIVLDYLQLVKPPKGKNDRNRENEVSELSRGTLQIARELKVPLLEASQLSRKVEERPDKRPLLSDLRESGGLEQDAYGVLMLYRADYYRKPEDTKDNTAEILVRKARQGGKTGRAIQRFHAPSTGFFDLAPAEYDELPIEYRSNND